MKYHCPGTNRMFRITYDDFREAFLQYCQSYSMTYTQLTRLGNIPFNLKVNTSVEKFVTERYVKTKELDPMSSEAHICNTISLFLPVSYHRQFASARALNLNDMLETIRKLELIYDTIESRRGVFNTTQKQKSIDSNLLGANKIYEVEFSSEEG